MFYFPPTLILRHRKENLKKCSLRGLESRPDFRFFSYPKQPLSSLAGYVLLTPDAPPLSDDDKALGLFLIDGTWRLAAKMFASLPLPHAFILRSIPGHFRTAYPRCQEKWIDPDRGLASVEALFIAYKLLGRDPSGLLDHYHFAKQFLEKNPSLEV